MKSGRDGCVLGTSWAPQHRARATQHLHGDTSAGQPPAGAPVRHKTRDTGGLGGEGCCLLCGDGIGRALTAKLVEVHALKTGAFSVLRRPQRRRKSRETSRRSDFVSESARGHFPWASDRTPKGGGGRCPREPSLPVGLTASGFSVTRVQLFSRAGRPRVPPPVTDGSPPASGWATLPVCRHPLPCLRPSVCPSVETWAGFRSRLLRTAG